MLGSCATQSHPSGTDHYQSSGTLFRTGVTLSKVFWGVVLILVLGYTLVSAFVPGGTSTSVGAYLSASHRILQTTMQSFCAPGYTGMRPAHKAVCSTAIITTTCALGEGKCYRFSFPRYLHPHTRARAHHHDLNYIIRSPHYVPVSTRSHPE
ncbi:hypothetical protein GGP41_010334 [Bipolaris sorokiniana]|uniref:Uncharacterized protein n=1 Tax=Cochliobolus sativus TaxID=45130 RepID=A0A8H6DWR5_COCSA|nr:hypothetical protein GGP41_010334 [Bipolaris sorokiniana]